jgi:aryl-alcohol dehydrogenase-like predicted oxidoreductase
VESRRLGRSEVEVSRIILGCGNFGGIGSAPAFFGQGETREQAFAIMDAAWAMGVTTFDTADAYGGGRSESWIGEWLRERRIARDEIVLSTKVFNPMDEGLERGLAPDRVRRQLESSLERLGARHVDMYLTHEPDPDTPLADTLAALEELRAAGRMRAIGGSNLDAETLREGLGTYEWVQNSYSLLDRGDEAEVLPLCRAHGLGYTPFSPLAGGWLTGKYRRGEPPAPGSRMATRPEPYLHLDDDRIWDGLDTLARAAAERGVDTATLALAWLLAQPEVTAVVVGPRRPEHLEPARRALGLGLTGSETAELAGLFV